MPNPVSLCRLYVLAMALSDGTPGVLMAELQTQHAIDTSVRFLRLEPLWHFRARTTPQGGGLAQVRTGPILQFQVKERVKLIAGYYFTRDKDGKNWGNIHRPFAGGEIAAWNRGVELDVRTLVERFAPNREPDYTRFRSRFRITHPSKAAPYAGVEVFGDAHGWRSIRYSAGLRRTLAEEIILDFSYFFEDARPGMGNRHMLGTSIHWRNKLVLDPDL